MEFTLRLLSTPCDASTPKLCACLQSKKQSLKEKVEADVGALVQFLLDERDSLLESLDAEEVAATAVIEDNLKTVEVNVKAVDKAIADISKHMSGKTSFEVSLVALCQPDPCSWPRLAPLCYERSRFCCRRRGSEYKR